MFISPAQRHPWAPRASRRWVQAAGFALLLLLLWSCQRPEEPTATHSGPIVLITFDALRADVVGGLTARSAENSLTPNMDRLGTEAAWFGRGVTPSSWTVPSMASLFTGLQPWKHQALHAGQARLRDALLTLPEALQQKGFRTFAYRSNRWLAARFGYRQGFEEFRSLRQGRRAAGHLSALEDAPVFIWIHILPPHAPYRMDPRLLQRLPDPPDDLPQRVEALDLEPFYDPGRRLGDEAYRRFWSMYQLNVAWADRQLGILLSALRESGQWDRTLLVVTSDHGEEFGEYGQIAHGGSLGRVLLEVPLLVKLPRDFKRALKVTPDERVGIVRLWATLVEAAGGRVPPGIAASLFRRHPEGVLSELYLGNGVNSYSLLVGQERLGWETRFGPSEPDYYRARLTSLGGTPSTPLTEPVATIFARLGESFGRALPLSGDGAPRLRLERWLDDGRVEPVDDPRRREELAQELRRLWMASLETEEPPAKTQEPGLRLTPEDRQRLRALGYVTE